MDELLEVLQEEDDIFVQCGTKTLTWDGLRWHVADTAGSNGITDHTFKDLGHAVECLIEHSEEK